MRPSAPTARALLALAALCAPAGCNSDHCTEWFEGWPRTAAPPVRCCPDWRAACGDVCPDYDRDRMNCGACGRTCDATQSCVSGECACFAGGALCPGAGCVALSRDPAHCGACGRACAPSQVCANGSCACPANGALCPVHGCVDLLTDRRNCGGCGRACGDSRVCVASTCRLPE